MFGAATVRIQLDTQTIHVPTDCMAPESNMVETLNAILFIMLGSITTITFRILGS